MMKCRKALLGGYINYGRLIGFILLIIIRMNIKGSFSLTGMINFLGIVTTISYWKEFQGINLKRYKDSFDLLGQTSSSEVIASKAMLSEFMVALMYTGLMMVYGLLINEPSYYIEATGYSVMILVVFIQLTHMYLDLNAVKVGGLMFVGGLSAMLTQILAPKWALVVLPITVVVMLYFYQYTKKKEVKRRA